MRTSRWRLWTSTLEWDANVTVPPDIRHRLAAFLDHVWAAIAQLAAAVADATDDDLIALLVPPLLRLHIPAENQAAETIAAAVRDQYIDTTDADRIEVGAALDRILAGKAEAVQWAVWPLCSSGCCAVLTSERPREDADALELAADTLASSMRDVLQDVCTRAIPPQAYHVM